MNNSTDNLPSTHIDIDIKKENIPYIDAVNANEQELQEFMKGDIPIKFDWSNKWLKGDEYSHILTHMEDYCKAFDLPKFTPKMHPDCIYIQPKNGMLYFVRGNTIGSDFGFPRLGIKKRFKWKKMNFTTDLPKKDPIVSYIVASAVKCEKFFPGCSKEGPVYRMHAVILTKKPLQKGEVESKDKKNSNQSNNRGFGVSHTHGKQPNGGKWIPAQNATNYILCHVRKVTFKKSSSQSDAESTNEVMQDLEGKEEQLQQKTQLKLKQSEDNFLMDDESEELQKLKNQNQTIATRQPSHILRNNSTSWFAPTNKENRKRSFSENEESIDIKDAQDSFSLDDSSDSSEDMSNDDSDYIVRDSNYRAQKKRAQKEARKMKCYKTPKQVLTHKLIDCNIGATNTISPSFDRKYSCQTKLDDNDLERDVELVKNLLSLNKRQKRSESLDQGHQSMLLEDQKAAAGKAMNNTQASPASFLSNPLLVVNTNQRRGSENLDKEKVSAFKPVERKVSTFQTYSPLLPIFQGQKFHNFSQKVPEHFTESAQKVISNSNTLKNNLTTGTCNMQESVAQLQQLIESRQSTAPDSSAKKSSLGSPSQVNSNIANPELYKQNSGNYVNVFNALFNFCCADSNSLNQQIQLQQQQILLQQLIQQQQQQQQNTKNQYQFSQFR